MARFPQPFFRAPRQLWYVQIGKKQYNLGPDKDTAFAEYHRLMSRPQIEVDSQLVIGVLDGFLTWEKTQRAKRTYEDHKWHIQRFIDALPGAASLKVSEFKPHHVKNWTDALNGGDTYRRNAIRSIKRAFSWALEYGYIETNPIAGIRCPAAGRREKLITPEIYTTILTRVRGAVREMLIFAWETGARPQEIKRMEARHFDEELARFRFPKEESKGKKKPRIIYLTDTALAIAKRLVALHRSGPIFRNCKGRPWTTSGVNCAMCRLKKKIGEKFALYDFRHSFAHRMLLSGMDSLTLAELMGHEDLTMLKKVYGHLEKGSGFLLSRLQKASGGDSEARAS